jgi:hypothetical protein
LRANRDSGKDKTFFFPEHVPGRKTVLKTGKLPASEGMYEPAGTVGKKKLSRPKNGWKTLKAPGV